MRWTWALCAVGCGDTMIDGVLLPDVDAAEFVSGVDQPLFPIPAGAAWEYSGPGDRTRSLSLLADARTINGVATVGVREVVSEGGVAAEQTDRWYAQDADGNVWWLGNDTCQRDGDTCLVHSAVWEWGTGATAPGIAMWAAPEIGVSYFRVYDEGKLQEVEEVLATGQSADTDIGAYEGCVRTAWTSSLAPGEEVQRVYCPGAGLVLAITGDGTEKIVAASGL